MPPRHETRHLAKLRAAERRAQAVKMFLDGNTYTDIAKEIGCTRQTIQRYIEQAEKEWAEEYTGDIHRERMRAVRRLRRLQVELHAAWEKSKLPVNRTRTRRKNNGEVVHEVVHFERGGDPRFTAQIKDIEKQIEGLLGIKPPDAIAFTNERGDGPPVIRVEHLDGMTDDQLAALSALAALSKSPRVIEAKSTPSETE